jgi:hypothetical protein
LKLQAEFRSLSLTECHRKEHALATSLDATSEVRGYHLDVRTEVSRLSSAEAVSKLKITGF